MITHYLTFASEAAAADFVERIAFDCAPDGEGADASPPCGREANGTGWAVGVEINHDGTLWAVAVGTVAARAHGREIDMFADLLRADERARCVTRAQMQAAGFWGSDDD